MLKTIKALSLSLLLLPMAAPAETGDAHTVKAESAILYESADENSPQVKELGRFAQVVEMDVQGEWYEVYVADADLSGWMLSSMLMLPDSDDGDSAPTKMTLSRTQMMPKRIVEIKIADTDKTPSMKEFEKYILKYSARTRVLKGYTPFTKVEPLQNGNLQVTATGAWLDQSKARQKVSLIILHTKWKEAVKNNDAKVVVVDDNENQVLNYPQ